MDVQAKLSLHLTPGEGRNEPKRFTVSGLWGGYILKPPSGNYQQLPEVEDLTMHLAKMAKIDVVPHSLIRLQSGNLDSKQQENLFHKMAKAKEEWMNFIGISFLTKGCKESMKMLISDRFNRLDY